MDFDMAFVQDALATDHDIEIPLFMPCTFFMPTELGLKFFKLPRENTIPLPDTPSIGQITAALENIDDLRLSWAKSAEQDDMLDEGLLVYEFRIKLDAAPSLWKRISLSGDMTLDEFAMFVSYEFFENPTADYSFHNTNNINPFTEISPHRKRKRKHNEKDAETITIEEFLQSSAQEFLLVIRDKTIPSQMLEQIDNNYNQGTPIKISVKFVGSKEASHKSFYPRVMSESKALGKL